MDSRSQVPSNSQVRERGWVSLTCELRDWARTDTVPAIADIVLTDRLIKE